MTLLPRDVKKAVELMRADPGCRRSIAELAAASGVAARTLQKHFRRFVGRTPGEVLRELRLEQVRRELLRASPETSVTTIATRCGIGHLGRFAAAYSRRYGETPSATVRRRALVCQKQSPTVVFATADRPIIHVAPFDLAGKAALRAVTIADEISAALLRNRWLAVGAVANARYRLSGRVCDGGDRRLRVVAVLSDQASGRHLWADRWDGAADDVFAFEERVASAVAAAIERSLRAIEVERVRGKDPVRLGAWDLTMRALPLAIQIDATSLARALEFLEQAMELAPQDALPMALAAWCHGQRGAHFFAARPAAEKQRASELALRAGQLAGCDAKVEALLGTAHTLSHDLGSAAVHFERALAQDGGCVWAWNRGGWLKVYQGRPVDAIESFEIAHSLDPADPLNFFCSIGIAAAHFEMGHDDEAAHWFKLGLAEHPQAVWSNRFRAPALALAGRREEARLSFAELMRVYPELTITQVRLALPHTPRFYDRASEGLASLGMRP